MLRDLPRALAVVVIAIGAGALAGWLLGEPALKSLLPGLVTMKVNTAIAFIMLGTALFLRVQPIPWVPGLKSRLIVGILGVAAATLGGLTMAEYASGIDLGIDQALIRDDQNPVSTNTPGRMSLATALGFLLSGTAVAALDLRIGRDIWPAQYMLLFSGILGLIASIGYLLDVTELYRAYVYTSVALHTAISFMLLSTGALLANPSRGFVAIATGDQAGSAFLRRLLPVAVLAPITVGWVQLQGQHAGFYETTFGLSLMVAALVLMLAAVMTVSARSLNFSDERRSRAEAEIRLMNAKLEERVTQRTAELENANRELEAFSYSVSHDLRAPVRAVDGFARILEEEHSARLSPEAARYLGLVRASSARMGQLIDDLLVFSRSSRKALDRHHVNPKEIVEAALQELAPILAGRRVDVVINDLPECDADPALLRQVYQNLLSNALKFTSKMSAARVEVGAIDGASPPVYYVKDDGAGFEMKYYDRLFGVFQRLHRDDEFDGTGVGLAIVHRIVQRHGGRVWGESVPGKGATFSFTLEGGAGHA